MSNEGFFWFRWYAARCGFGWAKVDAEDGLARGGRGIDGPAEGVVVEDGKWRERLIVVRGAIVVDTMVQVSSA